MHARETRFGCFRGLHEYSCCLASIWSRDARINRLIRINGKLSANEGEEKKVREGATETFARGGSPGSEGLKDARVWTID